MWVFFLFPLFSFFFSLCRCCWLSQVTGLKSRDFFAKLQGWTVLSPFLGSVGAWALCCSVRRWHPGCQGSCLCAVNPARGAQGRNVIRNTWKLHVHARENIPLLSLLPQSQQIGEGTGAALGKGCAAETTALNLVNNEVKLANTSNT